MESSRKTRKGLPTFGQLQALPSDVRVSVLEQVENIFDLFQFGQTSRDFRQWMKDKNVFGRWFRRQVGIADSVSDQHVDHFVNVFLNHLEHDEWELQLVKLEFGLPGSYSFASTPPYSIREFVLDTQIIIFYVDLTFESVFLRNLTSAFPDAVEFEGNDYSLDEENEHLCVAGCYALTMHLTWKDSTRGMLNVLKAFWIYVHSYKKLYDIVFHRAQLNPALNFHHKYPFDVLALLLLYWHDTNPPTKEYWQPEKFLIIVNNLRNGRTRPSEDDLKTPTGETRRIFGQI